MSILIITEISRQTLEGYDAMLGTLEASIRQAPGFVMHASHPTAIGWRVVEVWNSVAQANQFFAERVVPHLPPGTHPKRATQELHSLVPP